MPDQLRKAPLSPFVPGTGSVPPVLAGRTSHKQRLRELCDRLLSPEHKVYRPAVIIGPRGNGKTVLLRWLKQYAEKLGVDTDWVTPQNIPSLEALAERVRDKRWSRRQAVQEVGVSGKIGDMEGSAAVRLAERQGQMPPDLTRILTKRATKKPFALLVDEAHTLNTEVGSSLLNSAQEVLDKVPFFLVLAGTPDLQDALDEMNSTFWNRSLPVGVGRLKPKDAKLAIEEPLAEARIRLGCEDLWQNVLAECQGYPYFVQLLGDSLWRTAFNEDLETQILVARKRSGAILDEESVQASILGMAQEKQYYYERRCEELDRLDLMDCAGRLAESFCEHETVHTDKVKAVIQESVGEENTQSTMDALRHIGYIWMPPGSSRYYEPGIPSLMNFVAADRQRAKDAVKPLIEDRDNSANYGLDEGPPQ